MAEVQNNPARRLAECGAASTAAHLSVNQLKAALDALTAEMVLPPETMRAIGDRIADDLGA